MTQAYFFCHGRVLGAAAGDGSGGDGGFGGGAAQPANQT